MQGRVRLCLLALGTVLLMSAVPFIGPIRISPSEVLGAVADPVLYSIFWQVRVPRVLLAFLAGAGLSLGGLVLQALFSNFLASPFTLGVASGAAFGAALYFNLGLSIALFGINGVTIFAVVGAMATVAPIYFMSVSRRGFNSTEILLAGVVLSLFFSSLILFVQCISDFSGILRITRWLMGGFESPGYESVYGVFPFVILGAVVIGWFSVELNLLTLGDELAEARGLNARQVKALLFVVTSVMVGGVVAFCGPISSVGIMAPHICRILLGLDHRALVPAALLGGGVLVVVCDTIARTVISPYEIPVGVITALIEGPFFLWLLYRRRLAG